MIGMLSLMNPAEYRCQAIRPSSQCSCHPRRFEGELIRHKSSSIPPPTPSTFSSSRPDQWGIHKQAWRISEMLTLRGSLRPYGCLIPTSAHSLSDFHTPLWPFSIISHFYKVFCKYCSTLVIHFLDKTKGNTRSWFLEAPGQASWSPIPPSSTSIGRPALGNKIWKPFLLG